MNDWRPGASQAQLIRRAELLRAIRMFFAERGVLEVQTPVLSKAATTAVQLDSFTAGNNADQHCGSTAGGRRFLRTSPELALKRLLCAGSGDIYELGPVFRSGEAGSRHNPEFTLLEWYRNGYDHHQLMDEVARFLATVLPDQVSGAPAKVGFSEAFEAATGCDPEQAPLTALHDLAGAPQGLADSPVEVQREALVDLLFATRVAARFERGRVTLVHGFPAAQAALARLEPRQIGKACRFEAFVGPVELANGFHELADPLEQAGRFAAENAQRVALGKQPMPVDEAFLSALRSGLPDCAGVAVGVDRLVMLAGGCERIDEVLAFGWERA